MENWSSHETTKGVFAPICSCMHHVSRIISTEFTDNIFSPYYLIFRGEEQDNDNYSRADGVLKPF